MTNAIPTGFHSVTPYLTVENADEAIDFYKKAFGAEEVMRLKMGDKVGHAEVKIGDSHVMLSDEWPDYGKLSPKKLGGSPTTLSLYVEDCDATFKQALQAGAKESRPLEDQFYGDRSGSVVDPFGHEWMIATHKEDIDTGELQRRMDEMVQQAQQQQPEPA